MASGRVRTPQRVEVASQITGRVTAVAVREGDAVTAGQVLLQLDAAEWQASVAQARASLAQAESRLRQIGEASLPLAEQTLRQAEANARQAERQHQRVGELVAKGFYSPAQLDDAQRARDVAASQLQAAQIQVANNRRGAAKCRVARSNVDQAGAALAVAEARLAYATLRAPVAGRVLTRNVEPGDTAQPGKALLTLAPDGDTELTAQIDEKNFGLLTLGQSAQVSADAYPGERFPAKLSYIAPSIDALRGSVEIRLRRAATAGLPAPRNDRLHRHRSRPPPGCPEPALRQRARSRRPAVGDGRARWPHGAPAGQARPARRRRAARCVDGLAEGEAVLPASAHARRRPAGCCGQPEIRARN